MRQNLAHLALGTFIVHGLWSSWDLFLVPTLAPYFLSKNAGEDFLRAVFFLTTAFYKALFQRWLVIKQKENVENFWAF